MQSSLLTIPRIAALSLPILLFEPLGQGAGPAHAQDGGVNAAHQMESVSILQSGLLVDTKLVAQGEVADASGTAATGTLAPLAFPKPRGEVIFEHRWLQGDVPEEFAQPGTGKAGTRFADKKFRLPTPLDGRLAVVRDPETAKTVLDILVTKDDYKRTRSKHTEIEVHIPDHWTNGRFMIVGQRYLLEFWRKNLDYRPDGQWEIWSQNHSRYDSKKELPRNPAVALGVFDGAQISLTVRGDSNDPSIPKKPTRPAESFPLGPAVSDRWEFWQIEIAYDHQAGTLKLWRDGQLLYEEEGTSVGYNDVLGAPWSFGWYKQFETDIERRQAYIGPIRVQRL